MSEKLEKFRNTHLYKELIKNHSLEEVGVWEIRGEAPNCDCGGSHYQPHIATVRGKLLDVIKSAVELPNFWTWGFGGSFKKIDIIESSDLDSRAKLATEKKRLEDRIKEINALL